MGSVADQIRALNAQRVAAGQCRHCGGAVPCWSAFGDAFVAGSPVWYRQTCRGGYGFERDVSAVYLGRRGVRELIQVQLKDGTVRNIRVKVDNLRVREVNAP